MMSFAASFTYNRAACTNARLGMLSRSVMMMRTIAQRLSILASSSTSASIGWASELRPRLRCVLFLMSAIASAGGLLGCKGFSPEIRITQPHSVRATVRTDGTLFPQVVGTDGSSTGTASFLGNFTAIVEPSGMDYALQRQADCSLNLITGTLTTTSAFTIAANMAHYETVLHKLASLKTVAGTYPRGCVDKNAGVSTRAGVFAGRTTQGLGVFVSGGYFGSQYQIHTAVVKPDLSSATMNTLSLANAGKVATSDLNGDGIGDLVVVNGPNGGGASVAVLIGNADGSFKTPVLYPTAGTRSISAVIDDVNGDGKLDLIVASNNQMISVLLGNGDGTFNAAQSFPAVFAGTPPTTAGIINMITLDTRGIGKKDIIASNGLELLGNGDGTFTVSPTPAFPYTAGTSVAAPFLANGDFNGDGKLDLVLSTGHSVLTYLGKGDGTFTPGKVYPTTDNIGFVTVADLDGDGTDDIYLGVANGGMFSGDAANLGEGYVLLGNGDGTFQGAPQGTFAYNGHNLGDVNGDGQQDLITVDIGSSNTPSNTFTVQLGTASGGFNTSSAIVTPASFVIGGKTYSTANTTVTNYFVADINGDGKADLVYLLGGVFTPINGPLYFTALSNGDGTFATPVPHEFPSVAPTGSFDVNLTVDGLQIADFNRDGKADLLFTYGEQQSTPGSTVAPFVQGFAVLPGAGNGTFGAPTTTLTYNSTSATILSPPEVGTVVDLNGDGSPDLLVVARKGSAATGFGSELRLYLGNADGTFQAPSIVTTASNPHIPAYPFTPAPGFVVADFNKDGKLDLAVLGETPAGQGQLAISLGNGNGTFGAPTILNVPGGDTVPLSSLAAADFDGDGNIDLAFLDPFSLSGVFYGKGDGTFLSVPNGDSLPKDLINLYAAGPAVALDLNKDGKPDLVVGNTLLLSLYGTATSVTPAASTTTLTASASTAVSGTNITFTATVAGASGVPTGTVTFTDSLGGAPATTLGTGTLNASGTATFATTTLAVGTHVVTASYGGSSAYSASASTTATVVINAVSTVPSTTTLSAAPTAITFGQSITLTATVSGAAGVATGTITFKDSLGGATATALGSGTLNAAGVATFSTTTLATGSHLITATYGGNSAYLASSSTGVTVLVSAVTAVASSTSLTVSPTSPTAGQTVALTATVTGTAGIASGTVTFSDSFGGLAATTLGTGTLNASGVATFSTTALAVGTHAITASYGGSSAYNPSSSTAVSVVVAAAPAADFSVVLSPASGTVKPGTTASTTVTITPINGFTQAITFACIGLPSNVSCAFSPTTVTPAGGPVSTTLTFTRSASGSLVTEPRGFSLALTAFGLGWLALARRKRRLLPLLSCFLLLASGCGNSGPPSVTTVTVVATAGSTVHSAGYTLTSQ